MDEVDDADLVVERVAALDLGKAGRMCAIGFWGHTRDAAGRTTQTPVRGRPAPARRCEHRVAVARVGRIR
jgi:hypothetical protein